MGDGYEAEAEPIHLPVTGDVDRGTLEAARRGDAAAFERIVRHYDLRLRGLAFRLLGDAASMDDALQEAYVNAFRAMPRFSGRSSIGTWLYRIAYNACIDQLRRRGTPMATAEEARDVRSAADTEHAALTRLTLAEALAALPVDQRAAVLLVDVDGFSYAEAGGILGCGAGTVASRLSRARASLRAALAEAEATEVAR